MGTNSSVLINRGKIKDLRDKSKIASPCLANKKFAPILFIGSKNDLSVPYEYTKKTVEKLKKLDVFAKLLFHNSDFYGDVDPAEVKKRGWKSMWSKRNPSKIMFHNEVLEFLKIHLS